MIVDSNIDTVTARLIAAERNTSSSTLEQLKNYKDPVVRRLVAQHHNASKQTLLALSVAYPDEVVENVAFKRLLKEEGDDLDVKVMVARSSTVSADTLATFAESNQKRLLIAVGRNANTPTRVLEKLGTFPSDLDMSREQSQEIKRLKHLSESDIRRQQCPEEYFDWIVSENKIKSLKQDYQEEIIAAVASNPSSPVSLLRKLSDTWPKKRYFRRAFGLSSNPNTPTNVLQLVGDRCLTPEVCCALLRNPSTPANVLRQIIGRQKYTSNDLTSADPTLSLIKEHPNTPGPAEELEALHRLRMSMGRNSSQQELEELADSSCVSDRILVAGSSNTPVRALEKLTDDVDLGVKLAVARNRTTPAEILKKLADDVDLKVRLAVARNRTTPAEILKKLTDDVDLKVRLAIAGEKGTPIEILEKLANEADPSVRIAIARRTSKTTAKILEKLASDADPTVRVAIAKRSALSADGWITPIEILKKLTEDADLNVRLVVAKNWTTPVEILEKLTEDADSNVRAAVVENLRKRGF